MFETAVIILLSIIVILLVIVIAKLFSGTDNSCDSDEEVRQEIFDTLTRINEDIKSTV